MKDNARYIHRGSFDGGGAVDNLAKFVDWDYMGSSEFEFGSFPRTFKLMRSLHRIHPMEIREIPLPAGFDDFRPFCYAVSSEPTAGFDLAKLVLEEELQNPYSRLRQEPTYIRNHFMDDGYGKDTDCWLNVNTSLPRTSESYYSEDVVNAVFMRELNPFRPFFLTSNRTAAELFLARIASQG